MEYPQGSQPVAFSQAFESTRVILPKVTKRLHFRRKGYFWVVEARCGLGNSLPETHRTGQQTPQGGTVPGTKGENSVTSGPHLKTGAPPGGLTRKRPVAACLRPATQLDGDQLDDIVSYVRSLLRNVRITRHFETYHRNLLGEFRNICEATAPAAEAAG